MLLIVGTVPDKNFPLTFDKVSITGNKLVIGDKNIDIQRGTPALIAAAACTLDFFNCDDNLLALLSGDEGNGAGSREIYKWLVNTKDWLNASIITFHYLMPDVEWHCRITESIRTLTEKPVLIADAGFMYVAKMSGEAGFYDIFTPDAGELAFLADEKAPHPLYTRGFILHDDTALPELAKRAFKNKDSAKILVIKGADDFIADENGIVETISKPSNPYLEAVGGTGDTLCGILSALCNYYNNKERIKEAAKIACKINRIAGVLGDITPASKISELIYAIPKSLETFFKN